MVARKKATPAVATTLKEEVVAEEAVVEEQVTVDAPAQNGVAHADESVTAAVEEQADEANKEEETKDAIDGTVEGNETAEVTAAVEEEEADKPLEKSSTFDNDSAAVVQHLAKLRFSVGLLTLEQVHDPQMVEILQEASGYQIHVPRVLNCDEVKIKYAMLDVEFPSLDAAKEGSEKLKKLFEGCEMVKVENWPDTKSFYNDYHYMGLDEKLHARQKEGILTAGYHKLRDRWVVLPNVEPDVSSERLQEMIGDDFVYMFRKDNKKRVYVRMDTKEANQSALANEFKINHKVYKFKPLTPHPTESKSGRFGSYNNNYNPNYKGQQNNNRGGNYRGGYQQQPNYQHQMPMQYNMAPQYGQPQFGYYGPPQGPSQFYGNQKRQDPQGFYGAQPASGNYYNNGPGYQQKRPRY